MVPHQNLSPLVVKQNNLEQRSSGESDGHAARIPVKNSADWEQPDFEEIDICMEITAYAYHWQ